MFIFTPDKYPARKVSLSLFYRRVRCPVTPGYVQPSAAHPKFKPAVPIFPVNAKLPLNKQHILSEEACVTQVLMQEVATISNLRVDSRLG